MAWKKLAYQGRRGAHDGVRICKNLDLALSVTVYKQLGEPRFVTIFADAETDRLALRAAQAGETGAVPVSRGTAPRRIRADWAFALLSIKPAQGIYQPKPESDLLVIGPIARADAPSVAAVRSIVQSANGTARAAVR